MEISELTLRNLAFLCQHVTIFYDALCFSIVNFFHVILYLFVANIYLLITQVEDNLSFSVFRFSVFVCGEAAFFGCCCCFVVYVFQFNTSKNKILNKENLGFNCLYSNVDQLLNKMEDLQMLIASSKPDLMLFTEVIPKAQVNHILDAQLKIKGYELYTNFDILESNLGA